MGTSSNKRESTGNENNDKMKKSRKKGKIIIFSIEIVAIIAMLVVLYFVMSKSNDEGASFVEFPEPKELDIHEEIQKMTEEEDGTMHGYLNVALFGVDAVNEKQLYKASRSDCTMIASINLDTSEVKLVSVYRDTFLNLSDDSYEKCNGAYSYGGALQAVKMLNMNLDMNIEKFITVGYKGLSEVIDGLGGVYVDISESELQHINSYQYTIVNTDMMKDVTKGEYTPVTQTGYQKLNGLQAAAYCRIRYGDGKGDFGRTERQREVLLSIQEQAKKADPATLVKIVNSVFDDIYTSFSAEEILELLPTLVNYNIIGQEGFPQEDMRTIANLDSKGSCIIPIDLESNVVWLHRYLFGDEDYTVTESVRQITSKIKSETSAFIDK